MGKHNRAALGLARPQTPGIHAYAMRARKRLVPSKRSDKEQNRTSAMNSSIGGSQELSGNALRIWDYKAAETEPRGFWPFPFVPLSSQHSNPKQDKVVCSGNLRHSEDSRLKNQLLL